MNIFLNNPYVLLEKLDTQCFPVHLEANLNTCLQILSSPDAFENCSVMTISFASILVTTQLLKEDMVSQAIGAIFVGTSGLGKSHLARALGYAACQRGQRVLFLACSTMVNRLVSAEATKDLEREIKKLLAPALCIIDELGYITMSHQDAYSGQIDRLFRRKSIARSDLNRSPIPA